MDPCLGAGLLEVSLRIPEVLPQQAPAVTDSTARQFRAGTGTERKLPSASLAIPQVNFGVTVLPNTYQIIAKWEEINSIYKPLMYFQLKVRHVNS